MPSPEIVDFLPRSGVMPAEAPADLPAARRAIDAQHIARYPAHPGVTMDPVRCGDVDAVWYRPPGAAQGPVILYFHGGGFMWYSATAHQGVISRLAFEAGVETLAIDYKLAPGSPFPGPVDEGVRLYRWLLAEGWPAERIAFAGDSAGGGLALAVIVALQRAGDPLPACVAASSAWFDMTNSGESVDWVANDPCVNRPGLELCRRLYLQGHDPADPLASPLFADLAGFPPLLIQAGSLERLMSDSTRLAAKACAAGVDARIEVYDGCPHLWHWYVPQAPESAAAFRSLAAFVRAHAR